MPKLNLSIQERFEQMTIPEPNSGCLLWLGATDRDRYGVVQIDGKQVRATHVAMELSGRSVPTGMFACHTCDTPECAEETHLFHGTALDNARDMIAKGRQDYGSFNAKKTHCPRGHPYDEVNTYDKPSGGRQCRMCVRDFQRRKRSENIT